MNYELDLYVQYKFIREHDEFSEYTTSPQISISSSLETLLGSKNRYKTFGFRDAPTRKRNPVGDSVCGYCHRFTLQRGNSVFSHTQRIKYTWAHGLHACGPETIADGKFSEKICTDK